MIEKVIDIKWQFGKMENSNSHKINSNFDEKRRKKCIVMTESELYHGKTQIYVVH